MMAKMMRNAPWCDWMSFVLSHPHRLTPTSWPTVHRGSLARRVGRPPEIRGSRCRRGDVWRIACGAEEEEGPRETRTLPIFPLSVVAMPGCLTPLFIFEARYRVLFNTLLAGEENLEEDLIQDDSPFKGSREFGLCFTTEGSMAKVGTVLNVQHHQRQPDGQLVIVNKGTERFRVKEIVQTRPVVICDVEMLPDTSDAVPSEEIQHLSEEVSELYRNVARLTRKVRGTDLEAYTEPDELHDMNPVELSFWFASLFTESQIEQQKILEERSCQARLRKEKEIFDEAVKYLSAASALKGAFQSDV